MSNENCIFCKIIAGEIPSITVYEDDKFKAIFDIYPASKGHILVLPKKHIENIYELDDETASIALPLIARIARAVQGALKCDGINIMQNNGIAAGQSVFHLHFHIIPRFDKDTVITPWRNLSYEEGEANTLAEAIRRKIT